MSVRVSARILCQIGVAVDELDKLVQDGVTFAGTVDVYATDGEPVTFSVDYEDEDEQHFVELVLP